MVTDGSEPSNFATLDWLETEAPGKLALSYAASNPTPHDADGERQLHLDNGGFLWRYT